MSDNNSDISVEEDAGPTKRQKHPENFNKQNKLSLGKFHRYAISKPKKRTVTNKKRIRDLERLLEKKQDLPEEVKKEKLKEIKELKKGEKSKKEAEKFETRYKKIKFFEKKKVIRKLEKLEKQRGETIDEEELKKIESSKGLYKNYLTYVNNFPPNQKYISLFPTSETDKSKELRDGMMEKILKTAEVKFKIREKELLDMDKDELDGVDNDERIEKKIKAIEKKDAFFTTSEEQTVERKIVSRNGVV